MPLTHRGLFAGLSVAALLALVPGEPVQAHGPDTSARWRPPAARGVEVTVADAFGRSLQTVRHEGKLFVAGERGQRYVIRIDNPSATRVEVVVSVDGRDVVTGALADFTRNRGYVVEPFGSVTIDGFRTSMQSVAAFRFSSVGDSYSARQGTPGNVGVIGVAMFNEQSRQPLARADASRERRAPPARSEAKPSSRPAEPPARTNESSKASPGAASRSAPRRELGTAFGERRASAVVEVAFVRRNATRPDSVVTLSYDTPRGLAARGVPIEPVLAVERQSDDDRAWPGRNRFAPPPP